jgi:hypothetical protein
LIQTLIEVVRDCWSIRNGGGRDNRIGDGEQIIDVRAYLPPGEMVEVGKGEISPCDFVPVSDVRVDKSATTGEADEVVVRGLLKVGKVDKAKGVVRKGEEVLDECEGVVVRYGGYDGNRRGETSRCPTANVVRKAGLAKNFIGLIGCGIAARELMEDSRNEGLMYVLRVLREIGGPEFNRIVGNKENEFRGKCRNRGVEVR